MNSPSNPVLPALILVIEDDPTIVEALHFALEDAYRLVCFPSAETGLAMLDELTPDLLLLDIGLPGCDGFEACTMFREHSAAPVIFISGRESLEDRLRAYDVGGSDFVIKPFDPPILQRKVALAIAQKSRHDALEQEKLTLHRTAMSFLNDLAQGRILLDFVRQTLDCCDYRELARKLLQTTANYGLECLVRLRHPEGQLTLGVHGPANPLEESVLDNVESMGRNFRFKKRLAINYPALSLVVNNLPESEEAIGRVQDNLNILAEGANSIAETIAMRLESASRAEAMQVAGGEAHTAIENLREGYRNQQMDTRILLQNLVEGVEKAYYSLGLTDAQESRLSDILRQHADEILTLFEQGVEFDRRFASVLQSLAPPSKTRCAELF